MQAGTEYEKSSTEAELVGIDDAMGQVLWTRHFLAAQGEYVPTTTIYQDNKSTILLAENGRSSRTHETSQRKILLYHGPDKKRPHQGRVLPHTRYDSRFFHETTSRCSVCAYARKDTKPARQPNRYHSQECVEGLEDRKAK